MVRAPELSQGSPRSAAQPTGDSKPVSGCGIHQFGRGRLGWPDQLDGATGRSFRNLTEVRLVEPGHLTAYDVLWSDQVVFTSHTVGSVGRGSKYEVSDSDFIKDDELQADGPHCPFEDRARAASRR